MAALKQGIAVGIPAEKTSRNGESLKVVGLEWRVLISDRELGEGVRPGFPVVGLPTLIERSGRHSYITPRQTNFEDGLAVDEALGARTYVAEGRLGLAQALAATGDAARAIEHARAAAAHARRLDMPVLVRAADALLADATAKVRTPDPLAEREREVLSLVAQALSNRDVARALVISERTVESHVRSILAKTGLIRRVELLRWYQERNP